MYASANKSLTDGRHRLKLNAEKTELHWARSRYSAELSLAAVVCRCSLAQKLSPQVTTSVF